MIFAGICLMTEDVRKLADFYKEILQTASDYDDEIHQEIFTKGASFAILKNDGITQAGNSNMTMIFTVENVDEEYERLKKIGVKILDIPTIQPWGAKNMRFSDPDGNFVVFRTFL
mgnify:CR=1 FL=1